MAVTVRLFAALRDAAGVRGVEVAPAPLPAIIADLCERFGEPFTTRVTVASGMLDGQRVALDDDVSVGDGAELALLPPFSGGSTATGRQRQAHRLLLGGSLLVPALLILGGFSSRWAFGLVIVVIALGCLVDLHAALGTTSVRTILPAAIVTGIGPVMVLLASPAAAGQWVGALLAASVMLTFVLAFSSPRRHETAALVGSTMFAGMFVAVGTSALLVLNDALDVSQLAGALALIGLTDAAVTVVGRPATQGRTRRRMVAAVAVAVPTAVVLGALGGPPPVPARVAGLAVIGVAAALLSARLHQVLREREHDADTTPALLIGTADAVLSALRSWCCGRWSRSGPHHLHCNPRAMWPGGWARIRRAR